MIGEMHVEGVFFTPLVLWAIIALALNYLLRQILRFFGVYRVVWHSALFDFATFIILWAVVAAWAPDYPSLFASLR